MTFIINRYLIRETCRPLAAILGTLIALFASFSAADILADAVNGLLPTDMIAEMIGLKVLISLEVLIPISLYLSVVLSFGRLYGDSEFPAMFALGITPARVVGAMLTLSACVALLVAGLSLVARPWAYHKMHDLAGRAETTLNLGAMQAGTFYITQHGARVIFLAHRAGPAATARQVFVLARHSDRITIISAQQANPLPWAGSDQTPDVYMKNANIYEIGRASGQSDKILSAQGVLMNPQSSSGASTGYSAVAVSTARLASSSRAPDIAEFQWRLSTGLSTLLLGMLGIPLGRARPRQGKYSKFGVAILIYSSYYLLCTTARTLVQHSMVPRMPGIWWAPALLAFLLIIMAGPRPKLGFKIRRKLALNKLAQPSSLPPLTRDIDPA